MAERVNRCWWAGCRIYDGRLDRSVALKSEIWRSRSIPRIFVSIVCKFLKEGVERFVCYPCIASICENMEPLHKSQDTRSQICNNTRPDLTNNHRNRIELAIVASTPSIDLEGRSVVDPQEHLTGFLYYLRIRAREGFTTVDSACILRNNYTISPGAFLEEK